jgi:thiaminase/transcriptional activator TenA
MIATTDAISREQSKTARVRMHVAFTRATQLEWMFWDSAYRLEAWPI